MVGGLLGDGSAGGLPFERPRSNPLPDSPTTLPKADVVDEEETTSMRKLVQAIDAHVNLEVSSNL